jgi:hypothetical protein
MLLAECVFAKLSNQMIINTTLTNTIEHALIYYLLNIHVHVYLTSINTN